MNHAIEQNTITFQYQTKSLNDSMKITPQAIKEVRRQLDGLEQILDPASVSGSASVNVTSVKESYEFPGEQFDRIGQIQYLKVQIARDPAETSITATEDLIKTVRVVINCMGDPEQVLDVTNPDYVKNKILKPLGYTFNEKCCCENRQGTYSVLSIAKAERKRQDEIRQHQQEIERLRNES